MIVLGLKLSTRPPRHGWAGGHYQCKCFKCGAGFIGDELAVLCADCAYALQRSGKHPALLIPISKNGAENEQCRMFVEANT